VPSLLPTVPDGRIRHVLFLIRFCFALTLVFFFLWFFSCGFQRRRRRLTRRLQAAPHGARTHLAFNAPSRAAVRAFYEAALRHGGRGDGEPGVRERYGPSYYACFVFDPEGHRLEAVFQEEEEEGEREEGGR